MAIIRRRHKHGPGERKKHASELSARLAPLEELKPELAAEAERAGSNGEYSDATIKVSSASVRMPTDLVEQERDASHVFRLDRVVVVILCVMLAFIAFVAWQIARMPPTPPAN